MSIETPQSQAEKFLKWGGNGGTGNPMEIGRGKVEIQKISLEGSWQGDGEERV